MTVFIEDTPRNNLAAWVPEAVGLGYARGAILSPFASPFVGNSYKPAAPRIVAQLQDADAEVWFDPATHALQMPLVGDFRYYDAWGLWGGTRGDLSSAGLQRDHVRRVLEAQEGLGSQPLSPTVLLDSTSGGPVETALAMAEEALAQRTECALSIAGTPAFWAAEDDLDAVVGAFAQLNARRWLLAVVRSATALPVGASLGEVAGLCRTSRSLQQFGSVHVSHGDLAALPAVAAGASSVGSGWDTRQRVCSSTSYESRDPSAGGGGWFKRPTFQGLFGLLSRAEAERFVSQESALATRLLPGSLHPDGPKEAFLHHVACLSRLVDTASTGDFQTRYRNLNDLYLTARRNWPVASQAAGTLSAAAQWVEPFMGGLSTYAQGEGWV